MMQETGMADMIREAMEKKEGGKNSFVMTGQYTSSVKREGDREYVLYEAPNGEEVKVYGNWNEYAVAQDDEGQMMIGDEDYPIVENENGEYVFDEETFEAETGMGTGREAEQMAEEATGGPGASPVEDLMQRLSQHQGAGGGQDPQYAEGGRVSRQADRQVRQAGKQTAYLARKRQLPAVGNNAELAEDFRERRNAKLLKMLMGVVGGSVIAGGETVSGRFN